MSIFPCFTNILFSKSRELYHFLDLLFKFLNRQLVSKEAGERNQHATTTQGNHSQSTGKAERKPVSFVKQERLTTASTLFSGTTTEPGCVFCKSNHE